MPNKYQKTYNKAKNQAKKRYIRPGATAGTAQLAKDILFLKSQLNVEHKHLDFRFGSSQTVSAQLPTKDVPIVLALPVPSRGTAYNQRSGNQLKLTHMSTKLLFSFGNNTDKVSSVTATAQILFAKSGTDVPTISDLYSLDANGHYSPMSMVNTQQYDKYYWPSTLKHKVQNIDQNNRYPTSNANGQYTQVVTGTGLSAQDPAGTTMNIVDKYSNKYSKLSTHLMFQNGSDTIVEQMKPYLLLRSDVIEGNADYDPVAVSGIIRMTYVDN